MNAISKLFSVSVTSVLKWMWTFAQQYAQNEQVSKRQCVVLELDEMWYYISNKKINSKYGKYLIEAPDT